MHLKIHNISGCDTIVAACDADLIGQTLTCPQCDIVVDESFYGTEPATEEEIIKALKSAANANIIGEKVCAIALKAGIIDKETVFPKEYAMGLVKLLNPIAPHITEEIWEAMGCEGRVYQNTWPEYDEALNFKDDEQAVEIIKEAVKSIRNVRAEMNVPPSKKAKIIIVAEDLKPFRDGKAFFEKLASASEVVIASTNDGIDANAVNIVVDGAQIYLPMSELVDKEKELARLESEKKKLEGEIKRLEGKLSNAGFVAKAPAQVIEGERKKREGYESKLRTIEESIAKYKA